MIILSSDHGSEIYTDTLKKACATKSIPAIEFAHARASLMIKPYRSHGPFKVSQVEASLLDIPTTILSANQIYPIGNKAGFQGIDLLTNRLSEPRVREYFYYRGGTRKVERSLY